MMETWESKTSETYDDSIQKLRDIEFPSLKGVTYLDYGGSAIPAKSLLDDAGADLSAHLYGNPHSACAPSALAGRRVDEIRERVLEFFNADPKYFDLVFVANATAAMKLVMDCFKDHCNATQHLPRSQRRRFWYGYHLDAHNSLVGIRETADGGQHCFGSDQEVEAWIHGGSNPSKKQRRKQLRLFAYPGQSNMTGRRLPLVWPAQIHASPHTSDVYTLLDAAALATTSPLDLSDPTQAPDFTCLSLYKIFGYPDLGALIVRTANTSLVPILSSRRYFGGGTVDMVTCPLSSTNPTTAPFHAKKQSPFSPHTHLEDGTLPFHSILTLAAALSAHARLYTSMRHTSAHTSTLTTYLHTSLAALRHPSTNSPLLTIYNDHDDDDDDGDGDTTAYGSDPRRQGPILAFNVLAPDGATIVPPARVERAADARGVFVRSGSLCNPGGAARLLGWSAAELRRLHERDGLRCGGETAEEEAVREAVTGGRPTGVVRVSLGAPSVRADVDALVGFLVEWAADADGGGGGEVVREVAAGLAGGGGGRGGGVGVGISGGSSAEIDGVEGEKIRKVGKKRVLSLFSACYRGGKAEVSGKRSE